MKYMNLFKNVVIYIFPLISIILSLISFWIVTMNDAKLKKRELSPFPVIDSMVLKKRECGENPYAKRYYNGHYEENILSLNGQIDVIKFDSNILEHKSFSDECLNNRDSIYFSKFDNSNCIIFNMLEKSIDSNFFYEFCSTEVTIINYGALLNGVEILSAKITLDNNQNITIKGTTNIKSRKLDCVIPSNESLKLTCDEIVKDLGTSLCISDEDIYRSFDNQFDFLKKRLSKNSLKYKKIIFKIKCWNIIGVSYLYELILEKNNGFLTSYTKKLG